MTTSRKSDLRLRGLGLLLVCLAVSSIARPVVSAEERNVDKREALKEPTYTLEDMLSEALQPNFELNLELSSLTGRWEVSFDPELEKDKVVAPNTTLWETGAEWVLTATPFKQLIEFIEAKESGEQRPIDVGSGHEVCDLSRRWEAHSLTPIVRSFPDHRRRSVLLSLCVIHEQKKGLYSRWAPWLASFPSLEKTEQPIGWSEDDAAFLQNSPVIQAAKDARSELEKEYQKLTDLFFHPSKGFTLEDYLRATLFVLSNVVDIPIDGTGSTVTGLLPGIEMMECSLDPSKQIELSYSRERNSVLVHSPSSPLPTSGKIMRRCGMSNTVQSLFLNYGKFPPEEEIERVIEFLPLTIVSTKINPETGEESLSLANSQIISQLPEDAEYVESSMIQQKLRILRDNGLDNVAIVRESIQPLMITFRLLFASEEELRHDGNVEKILKGETVSESNDIRAINAIQNTILAILSTYRSTLQEDEAKLRLLQRSETRNARQEIALRLVILEKTIYEKSLKMLHTLGKKYGVTTFVSLQHFFQYLEENDIVF